MVEVSLERPADLADGVLLLQLGDEAGGSAGSGADGADGADPDAGAGGPDVGVRIDYSDFALLFGGGWSTDLEIRAFPECYAETPDAAECSDGVLVPSRNDTGRQRLEFSTLPAGKADAPDGPEAPAADRPATDDAPDGALDAYPSEDLGEDLGGDVGRSGRAADSNEDAAPGEPRPDEGSQASVAQESPGVVYALTAGTGEYGATPFDSATEWQTGTGSGDFSYSYDFELPAALGGTTPSLSLNYSSGLVDHITTEGSQVSAAGIGWNDLTVGSISRSYIPCEDDQAGPVFADRGDLCWRTRPVQEDPDQTEDLPTALAEELSLTFNGVSSRLMRTRHDVADGPVDPDTGVRADDPSIVTDEFRLREDPGWFITRTADAISNSVGLADDDGEKWKVKTPDGTTYFFGSLPSAESTWTVPVFGNDAGEPCHDNASADASECYQAYQWNLDRVVDSVGNEIQYGYTRALNSYEDRDGSDVQYVRSGVLASIDYGMQSDADNSLSSPRQQVKITTRPRCIPALDENWSAPGSGCAETKANQQNWPDTRMDLLCSSGCAQPGPSFFSTVRYHEVITSTRAGHEDHNGTIGVATPVRTYTLLHTLPLVTGRSDTTSTATYKPGMVDLWLFGISVTGQANGAGPKQVLPPYTGPSTTAGLPPVFFHGDSFANRVDPSGGQIDLLKYRLTAVRNELGGRIEVTYGHTQRDLGDSDNAYDATCTPAYVANLDRWNSNRECFAAKKATGAGPGFEWFHKYVVLRTSTSDDALHYRLGISSSTPSLGQSQVTDYYYRGAPAWRFTNSRSSLDADQAWDDWRGYQTTLSYQRKVTNQNRPTLNSVLPGAATTESITRTVQFRGMNGSRKNPDGAGGKPEYHSGLTVATDEVEDINGNGQVDPADTDPQDEPWLQGMVAETELKYPNGNLISREYTSYDWLTLTQPNGYNKAKRVFPRYTNTTTRLYDPATGNPRSGNGTRTHRLDYTVDEGGDNHRDLLAGVVTRTWDRGLGSDVTDDKCTTATFATNEADWHYAPSQSTLYDAVCPTGGGAPNQATIAQQSQTIYDNNQQDPAMIGKGLPTQTITQIGAAAPGDPDVDQDDEAAVEALGDPILTSATYDRFGRPTSSTDPNGHVTTTAYNAGSPNGATVFDQVERITTTQKHKFTLADTTGNTTATQDLDLVTVTDVSPATGLPKKVTDPNGNTTGITYDGLGRVTKVFNPRNIGAYPDGAGSTEYYYYHQLRTQDEPSQPIGSDLDQAARLTTRVLKDTGYVYSYDFSDGWGRTVETQTPSPTSGKRLVTSTAYDNRGLTKMTTAGYSSNKTSTGDGYATLVNPAPTTLQRYSITDYDAAARPLTVQDMTIPGTIAGAFPANSDVYRKTTSAYFGDQTRVLPDQGVAVASTPVGATTTYTDVWGRTTRVDLAKNTSGTQVEDTARYTYTPRDELDTVTKTFPATSGPATTSVWDYDYDWTGRQIKAVDPDTGITYQDYDPAGNQTIARSYSPQTNAPATPGALQARIITTYDDLNRPVYRGDTTPTPGIPGNPSSPKELARWFYDTAENGRGLLAATQSTNQPPNADEPATAWLNPTSGAAWHTIEKVTGYDIDGNTKGTEYRYPSWLTAEAPDAPADATGSTREAQVDAALADDANVAKTFTNAYDMMGNKTQLTYPPVPGIGTALPVQATYEATGARFAKMTLGTQVLGAATYNGIGQATQLSTWATNANAKNPRATLVRDYSYDQITGRTQAVTANSYATSGSTNNAPGTSAPIELLKLAYEYDTANNPRRISSSIQNAVNGTKVTAAWCYAYDPLRRLTRAQTGTIIANTTTCGTPTPGSASAKAVADVTGGNYDLGYTYSVDRLATVYSPGANSPSNATTTSTYSWTNTAPHQTTNISQTGSGTPGMPTTGNLNYDGEGRATTQPGTSGTTYDTQGRPTQTRATNLLLVAAAYDAAGMRTARREGATTTVYLAGGLTEITRTGTSPARGIHHFTTPGGTPLASLDTSTGDLRYYNEHADPQGNLRLAQDPTTSNTTTTNYNWTTYYPYGAPTANRPGTSNNRGYLGKTHDPNNNIRLDQRNYTPNLATLTTPDPIFEPADPQSTNPYAYSRNNPIANSDESGLIYDADVQPPDVNEPGNVGRCTASASTAAVCTPSQYLAAPGVEGYEDHQEQLQAAYDAANPAPSFLDTVNAVVEVAKFVFFDPADCDQVASLSCGFAIAGLLPIGKIAKIADKAIEVERAASRAANTGRTAARTCLRSFAGPTVVLMADGSKKPIEDIEVGDRVVATDPETGERVTREVTEVWVHDDQVLDLVVDGEVITTTEDHLFWSVTDQRFEHADQLASGEVVLGDGGRQITVSGFRPGTERTALAYNLSIAGVHTYHVGDGAILVHNDCSDAAWNIAMKSFDKHGASMGFKSVDEMGAYVDDVMSSGAGRLRDDGTRFWVDYSNSAIIFRGPNPGVPGSVYRPDNFSRAVQQNIDRAVMEP